MATNKKARALRLEGEDRIFFLEGQRELLQIKEEQQALQERLVAVNQSLINCLNSFITRKKVNPDSVIFDLKALELRPKPAEPKVK